MVPLLGDFGVLRSVQSQEPQNCAKKMAVLAQNVAEVGWYLEVSEARVTRAKHYG